MSLTIPDDAYVSAAECAAFVPGITVSDSGTTPTTTQFEDMIKSIAQEMNAILRGKNVTVPVTDTTGIATLKVGNRYGALWLLVISRGPSPELAAASDMYFRQYKEFLARLQKEQFKYGSGSHTQTKPRYWSEMGDGEDYEDPIFTRDKTW